MCLTFPDEIADKKICQTNAHFFTQISLVMKFVSQIN